MENVKKQMICIDPEANGADFYLFFLNVEKIFFYVMSCTLFIFQVLITKLSYLPKNI